MRSIELARAGSGPTPLHHELALGGEADHACVHIAVAHIEGPVGQHRYVRGAIEVASVITGYGTLSDRQQ